MSAPILLDDEDVALYLQPDTSTLARCVTVDAPLMAAELLSKRKEAAEMVAILRAAGLQGDALWALVVAASAELVRLQALHGTAGRSGLTEEEIALDKQGGMPRTILVEMRPADILVSISGRPEVWGAGASLNEAVGSLVRNHRDWFGVTLRAMVQP